jgi:hypothetical protein
MPRHDGTPNLIPNSQRTPEELHDMTVKGGIASGKARRLKKTQAEILRQVLALDYTDAQRRELLRGLGLEGNFADAINLSVAEKAAKGDVESARYVRDTIGEKPREGVELRDMRDKPVSELDMSQLTDAQLLEIAEYKAGGGE